VDLLVLCSRIRFAAHEKNRVLWVWVFGVLAALYNPIFRIHLDRSTWIGVNWVTIAMIVIAAIAFWRPKKGSRSVTADSATQKTDTKQDRAVKLGDFCRFQPNMKSVGSWRLEKDIIDLAAGDIVKVVGAAGDKLKDRMCYVNKPGNCPVIATMQLVDTDWLEPINGKFKECEYCAAIDHATSDCPYRGKVPYGWKGTGPWRVEGGKMYFDEGKPESHSDS
jgi:membrane protein implicated in regulation of membrane protease activity